MLTSSCLASYYFTEDDGFQTCDEVEDFPSALRDHTM